MTETAVEEKANGIPVPEEGTEEFARMNKMAKIAIPIVLIIFTMGVLQQQAFGMIYVNIGDQLGQANLAPLITSIPGIVLGIVCVIYGSLGDFVSLKKMMILGTIVFVLGSILGCFGDLSIWIVIAARTVQSAGWQVSGSIFLVLVSKYIEKKKRVIWYGVFVAVFRIAAALGVFLAGYMTLVDWRILFGIGIIAVFFIPILAKNLPDEHAKGARIDVIGFTLIGLFAGSVTMFFTDMTIFWGIAVLVTGVAFVVYINKAADPFITPEMLTNPAFAMTMIVIFVGYFFSYTLNAGCNAIGLNVYGIDSSQCLQPAGVVDHPRRHHGLRRWPDHPEDRPQGLHHSGARLHGRWPDRRCVPDSDGPDLGSCRGAVHLLLRHLVLLPADCGYRNADRGGRGIRTCIGLQRSDAGHHRFGRCRDLRPAHGQWRDERRLTVRHRIRSGLDLCQRLHGRRHHRPGCDGYLHLLDEDDLQPLPRRRRRELTSGHIVC